MKTDPVSSRYETGETIPDLFSFLELCDALRQDANAMLGRKKYEVTVFEAGSKAWRSASDAEDYWG